MMPSDMMLWVQQQSHREMQQQAEQTRLLRAARRVSDGNARTFQHLKWWAGRVLLSWGCALQQAGRATQLTEKGCSACLQ